MLKDLHLQQSEFGCTWIKVAFMVSKMQEVGWSL